jgi:ADP-heptose:LPS heptosyltransferase
MADGALLTRRVPYGPLRHEIDYYLDLLEVAGLRARRDDLALEPPREEAFAVPPGATVIVSSGGTNPNEDSRVRRLPDTLLADLVRACAKQGPVLFLGSPGEASTYAAFESDLCTNLCGRTNLAQAVSVLRQAARVITTDTGLMHLAAAVNPHVTAVFGPTHPSRKCPPGTGWVWADEGQYDERYDLFGSLPKGSYFDSLTVADILGPDLPSPISARCEHEGL